MTATPTPLRELLTQARREFRDSDAAGDVLDWLEERAALSARDEAGAVYRCDYCGSDYTRAKYCCQARREYLNAHGEYEIATPPASGEAVPMSELMEAQYELNELRAKLARYEAAVALPVDRYTFTLDGKIERSPTGEFVGYAEYRRLAAVAPAGMALPNVAAMIEAHAAMLPSNPYCYFELAYTRQTDWMAWLCSKSYESDPDRKVLACGRGLTPDEACARALAKLAPTPPATAGEE